MVQNVKEELAPLCGKQLIGLVSRYERSARGHFFDIFSHVFKAFCENLRCDGKKMVKNGENLEKRRRHSVRENANPHKGATQKVRERPFFCDFFVIFSGSPKNANPHKEWGAESQAPGFKRGTGFAHVNFRPAFARVLDFPRSLARRGSKAKKLNRKVRNKVIY